MKHATIHNRATIYVLILLTIPLLFLITGCSTDGGPRARMGYVPTATFGVVFANPDNLGTHAYSYSPLEFGGIVYTCRAGHLDIDHIRGNADATRYLVQKIQKTLSQSKQGFSFNLAGEQSTHVISFTYPSDWHDQTDMQRIIEEIAFDTGPYLAYQATIWHEILTWFGVKFAGIEPEFYSAFSWEDNYSNLLGTHLGIEAIKDTRHTYDEAMTIALDRKLQELQVQPRQTAIAASEKVRGTWYTGNLFIKTKFRNFDIGLSGILDPVLIPDIPGCDDPQPVPLTVHTLDTLNKYGFELTHQIKPNVFEANRIYKAAGAKKIYPEQHYPILIEYMKKDAEKRGYKLAK